MSQEKSLFFIALLPPQAVQDYAHGIKQHFADVYQSRKALNSPPHITLKSPFKWQFQELPGLENTLTTFASQYSPISITLSGFGTFPPRVIYLQVLPNPSLLNLHNALEKTLETHHALKPSRPSQSFTPHLTVAFRDLTRPNFTKAWEEFQHQPVNFQFPVPQLTLLVHDGQRWQIQQQFPFQS